MNKQLQDILIRISDIRPFKSVLINKVTGNSSRWLVKQLASFVLPYYFRCKPGIKYYRMAQQEGRISEAIVSLTSFPQRIGVVWLVVECLLRQTRVPQKIVLYLSKEQFVDEKSLPLTLAIYPKDIVEIRMVDGDIRSHKKYWYIVEDYKNTPVVLVDDDLIYDSHMIEDLEDVSTKRDNVVACCWGSYMSCSSDGSVLPYSRWSGKSAIGEITDNFFYGSGGGTYFPKGSLNGVKQPIDDIMRVCPYADDIWLNAITRINGYRTCLVRNFISMPEWKIKNNKTLNSMNNGQGLNDIQLQQVSQYMLRVFGIDPFKMSVQDGEK